MLNGFVIALRQGDSDEMIELKVPNPKKPAKTIT